HLRKIILVSGQQDRLFRNPQMLQSGGVRGGQPLREQLHQLQRLLGLQRSTRQPFAQQPTSALLDGNEGRTLRMEVQHPQEHWMLEGPPGRSLIAKPCVLLSFCVEKLEEDFSALLIPSEVNEPRVVTLEGRADAITPDGSPAYPQRVAG